MLKNRLQMVSKRSENIYLAVRRDAFETQITRNTNWKTPFLDYHQKEFLKIDHMETILSSPETIISDCEIVLKRRFQEQKRMSGILMQPSWVRMF